MKRFALAVLITCLLNTSCGGNDNAADPDASVACQVDGDCSALTDDCNDGVCRGGACDANPKAANLPCGDASDTQCTDPDTCDGAGNCAPNHANVGTSCGDALNTACSAPDKCNEDGLCAPNNVADGTTCEECTGGAGNCDGCSAGICQNRCGNGIVDVGDGEDCEPTSDAACPGACQAYCSCTVEPSCAAILAVWNGAVTGIHQIDVDGAGGLDPFDVYCDMDTDGGGWTLLGTVSGTVANGGTDVWNTQDGLWTDANLQGSVAAPYEDFKSQAWLSLDITNAEIMFQRRYDGVIRAQTKLSNVCVVGKTKFVELFVGYDDTLACGIAEITTIKAAVDATGVNGASYREGVGANALGGSSTNGWCWNGGDNALNTFQGHTGWNQAAYATCTAAGHLGYIGVYENLVDPNNQYENADITGTNWLFGTDFTKTDISYFAR